jgi:gliding motility-associated-like protein
MLKHFLLLILLFMVLQVSATHNRAGEITYKHLGGLKYEAVITTYTKTSASAADRPELEIRWGDSTRDTLQRESIVPLPGDAQRNIYRGTHIYAGAGTFVISMEDPNRNEGVINIPSSVNVIFYIESVLTISNSLGHNNSVQLLNPPLDNACIDRLYIHNAGAFDPDGDSLSYRLIVCKSLNGLPIPGYTFPNQWPPGEDNLLWLDQETGNLFWDSPQIQGEYNIAFLIEEWRGGILMGSVERDMQITAFACSNNPPEIEPIADTCIVADSTLLINITANDPDNNPIILTAFGEPLDFDGNTAVFSQSTTGPPAHGNFVWAPDCDRVRLDPYVVTIKAKDQGGDVPLVDFETFKISVISPGPENLDAQPLGNTVQLTWDVSICDHASGYNIYRRPDSLGYNPDNCVTGVPVETGYILVGLTEGLDNTQFTDNKGLALGQKYCYMVTATFDDGAESYPSIESCAVLIKDLPVMTNVSVGFTDLTTGRDTIVWSNPTELSEIQFPGPYYYKVYRGDAYSEPIQLVYTSPPGNEIIGYPDTSYTDVGINSQTQPNTYRVDLYSGDTFIGSTVSTSSIFLSTIGNDNVITLIWDDRTPWLHFYYEIYKKDTQSGDYYYLDSVPGFLNQYDDTGLVNLDTSFYYVKSIGGYTSESIKDTLINFSQETYGIPWDRTPPCPPELIVESDCEAGEVFLLWTNPNNYCADDVVMYYIYYSPQLSENEDDFQIIDSLSPATDTSILYFDLLSVAGCYAVTAVDSLLLHPDGSFGQNESDFSNIVCVDNCPEYEMPNVFTPNNDGINDLLIPINNRQVGKITFNVYNRWGTLVFETNNPAIEWDGKDMNSNEVVSDGIYYYTIIIESILLEGNQTNAQSGYIYVFANGNSNTN